MPLYSTELWSEFSLCFSDRLWFDELISLWASVQNLPSWEVVGAFIYLLVWEFDTWLIWLTYTLMVHYFEPLRPCITINSNYYYYCRLSNSHSSGRGWSSFNWCNVCFVKNIFPMFLQHLVNLFARLANDNIGYIDWDPYIPQVCWFSPL